MPRKKKLKEKCINPRCKNLQHARGLCTSCLYHVYNGECTQEQLIAAGKIWPSHLKAKQKRDWFKEQV
jgi:hypothetical protein